MNENLETVSTPEIAMIWCAEYARTTGCKATVVKLEGDWIYLATPSHDGQPWQRSHLILAIQTLRARPDFESSIFLPHKFAPGDSGERPKNFAESRTISELNVA